jgi:hypothetical protein
MSGPAATAVAHLERDVRKQARAYSSDAPLTREFEIRSHRHYQRAGYWHDDSAAMADMTVEG